MNREQLVNRISTRSKEASIWSELASIPTKDKVLYALGVGSALSGIGRGVAFLHDRKRRGAGLVEMRYVDKDELARMMNEGTKYASIGSFLLRYAPKATLFATLRNFSQTVKSKASDNAWSDALREKPIRALIPGLKSDFKLLYMDSPSAADRLLDHF